MNYPNFLNKHLEEALFHPSDFLKDKKVKGKFPKKYILTYQEKVKNYFIRKYKPKKITIYRLLTIYSYKNIGFVKMTVIGSPNAVTVLEELIALGGKEFLNIGTAGGLYNEGIFLCEKAIRDEGTSHHYMPHGDFAYPDKELTEKLGKAIQNNNLDFKRGTTWTIDAPYRETKAEVAKYTKEGVATVEMEASALFTVAKYRKVKIASAFVVSDVLGDKWSPKFHKFDVRRAQNKLIDSALVCFSEK
ncbi:MAG: purine-nucleoside phosphorylase [Candidatus Staskawiczbacteria bacterium]|nr:purine-nucleoside phosphorylase [Candidatus Staskawiczbacteria bacterium]